MANTNNPNNNSSDEIDLGQLFQMIGIGFNRIFRGFLRFFLYLKKNTLLLFGLVFLGGAIGFGLTRIVDKKMKTEVIVQPNLDSRNYLYEVVDEIQSNISSKDTMFFKELGILVENLNGFKITVESLGDTRKNTEKGTEYLELLKGFEGSSKAISDIVRAEILSKSTLINHKITFYFNNPILGQDYAKKLMKYINSNQYFVQLIGVYRENAKSRIEENKQLLGQVDEIITNYAKKMAENDGTAGNDRIVLDNQETVNITGLFDLKNSLIKDIEAKNLELEQRTDPIKTINFGKPQQVQKAFFGNTIILLPLIFVGLFFLVSFIKYLNRKSSELEG